MTDLPGTRANTPQSTPAYASAAVSPWGLCAVFLAFAFWKSPAIFIDPRFWAEEADYYFARCLHATAAACLTTLHENGSFQSVANVGAYLATLVPLERAPAVTTYLTLLLHLAIIVQLAGFVRTYRIGPSGAVLLAAAFALLPQTVEIWMTATNAQWLTGVSALFLLLMPSETLARHRVAAPIWSLFCVTSGAPACVLAPLFILRALRERSGCLIAMAAVFALGAAVQLYLCLSFGVPRPLSPEFDTLVLPVVMQTILAPLLSGDAVNLIAPGVRGPDHAIAAIAMVAVSLALLGSAIYAARSAPRTAGVGLLVLAWGLVSFVQSFGSLDPTPNISGYVGGRYFFLGAVSFCLLIGIGTTARERWIRTVATATLACIVLAGFVASRTSGWSRLVSRGPSWSQQVRACQPGTTCKVAIRPVPRTIDIER